MKSSKVMRSIAAFCALCAVALSTAACVRDTPKVRKFVTDAEGRSLILHGANISNAAKRPPDHLPLQTEAQYARMGYEDWGMNFARFILQWSQLEPEPGVYDEAYLDAVSQRVKWLADAGVYVVLDMHQDIYGPAVGGNGAPPWATRTDGIPELPIPGPWILQYLQPRVNRAFDHFWFDPDIRQHYVAAWAHVAARFAGTPNILGYDLMNEPWAGTQQQWFEQGHLAQMYRDVIGGIREVDSDNWIWLEPRSFGANQGFPSDLPKIDDPREGDDRIVYFPHLYTPEIDLVGKYDGNTFFFDLWATSRTRELARLDQPMLIGEFGLGWSMPGAQEWLREALKVADETGSGWAYWSYENDSGPNDWGLLTTTGEETPQVDELTRTYARAVAGTPVSMSTDPDTNVYEITFTETGVSAPTEFFVPEARHYPGGFEVTSSDPDGSWTQSWDPERQILSVTSDPSQDFHTITIEPRRDDI